jgi:rubrerythrin
MFTGWNLNELKDYSDRLYGLLDIVNEEIDRRETGFNEVSTVCPTCGAIMIDDEDCPCYDEV